MCTHISALKEQISTLLLNFCDFANLSVLFNSLCCSIFADLDSCQQQDQQDQLWGIYTSSKIGKALSV